MKHDEIFTRKLDGQVLEIGNWEARSSDHDAFIAFPLSDSRLELMQMRREQGKTDRQIYREMHPEKKHIRRAITLEDMTTRQIVIVAQELLNAELDSLERMAKADLIALVRRIASIKGIRMELEIRLDIPAST